MSYKIQTIKVGDFVNVINEGLTYTTHMEAADVLGADFDPEDLKRFNDRQQPRMSRYKHDTDKQYKFKYGDAPANNDICKCLNIKRLGVGPLYQGPVFVLIERLSDNQQFILSLNGLEWNDTIFWEDELFEL